ncbi:GntR family transcriptional regulator [Deinococcus peraridilitoris]|uniref:Putative transcriptional regulator n=1 Tax=Deinococcus peraridilitoris (strain DSM 19664 / LMG 22246 / CIP 109416 / KR-200) TaxID=937777 RepID=L0A3E6_DEIPD|nr:GntR family transcriptional regulator [Deinococcus peraridilitoris]AFZ68418.1 putative transcriptional regulator [Deinococcus peraridilitoris DSM 19664]
MRQTLETLDTLIKIDLHSGVPLYLQLAEALKRAIDLGQLQPGDTLPPVRNFASRLRIAPNTIVRAYAALQDAGMIESRAGAGTTITARSHAPPHQHDELLREFRLAATRLLHAGVSTTAMHQELHELESAFKEVSS